MKEANTAARISFADECCVSKCQCYGSVEPLYETLALQWLERKLARWNIDTCSDAPNPAQA